MRLRVKGKNVEVSSAIREYAEAKLSKLAKQLAEQTQVELELWEEKNPSIAASHVAEATIFTKGPTLRAREASPDMKASRSRAARRTTARRSRCGSSGGGSRCTSASPRPGESSSRRRRRPVRPRRGGSASSAATPGS